jgi:hypothetical protein
MSNNSVTQVNATNNQSMAKYVHDHMFLANNRYDKKTLTNTLLSAENTIKTGMLAVKTAAAVIDVLDVAANIANVIGILRLEGDIVLADDGSVDVNVATQGIVAEELIILPGGITLDTVIPTTLITLRDRLNELGFHLEVGTENTKFDNE